MDSVVNQRQLKPRQLNNFSPLSSLSSGKTILITGAAGQIGTCLRQNLAPDYQLRCLDIEAIPDVENMKVVDINNFEAVLEAMTGVEIVIHLAANPQPNQPWNEVYTTSIQGTYHVFEAARQVGVRKIIYASSCYGSGEWHHQGKKYLNSQRLPQPDCLYGVGKAFGEVLGSFFATQYNLSVICLRIGAFWLELPLDKPDTNAASLWCSPKDLVNLIKSIIQREDLGFQIFYAVSNNNNCQIDFNRMNKLLGYQPQDKIENYYPTNLSATINDFLIDKFPLLLPLNFPTYTQKLLLKAVFLSPKEAVKYWQEWNSLVEIENLDRDSNQLLVLLYHQLTESKTEAIYVDKLKGIYRHQWAKNQVKIKQLQTILQKLNLANIRAICLNDISLLAYYNFDHGQRSMNHFSLFIERKNWAKAHEVLAILGWQPQVTVDNDSEIYCQTFNHHHINHELYLLNRLFWAEPQDYTDRQIWHYATSIQFDSCSTHVLSMTDELLFLCLQAHCSPQIPLIHWLVDAILIFKTNHELDWVRLVSQAQRYQLILPLRNVLSYLNNLVEISIPSWVLPNLYGMPISSHELSTYYLPPGNKALRLQSWFWKLKKSLKL